MRSSIVPAQITTVEDKIAGNISVRQAILLGTPILFGFVISVLFPPSGEIVGYKIVITVILFAACGSLAIQIKERLLLDWTKLLISYYTRPDFYVYDKNSTYLRNIADVEKVEDLNSEVVVVKKTPPVSNISPKEFTRLKKLAVDKRSGVKFKVGKKGELNVQITEVK